MDKEIVWNEAAEAAFKSSFSAELQNTFILALREVAAKRKPDIKDTPHGEPFGHEVWKLKAKDEAGQWRVVYVRPHAEALYVVNAYQKKSPSGGSEEAPKDINTTRLRLLWAEAKHQVYLLKRAEQEAANRMKAKPGAKAKRKRGK